MASINLPRSLVEFVQKPLVKVHESISATSSFSGVSVRNKDVSDQTTCAVGLDRAGLRFGDV